MIFDRRRVMRRVVSVFLASLMLIAAVMCQVVPARAAETGVSRVINVVYDDSGSMARTTDGSRVPLDRWCQAKYAMEVFAAMLGEQDLMNVYVMSDFDHNEGSNHVTRSDAPPKLTLNGADGQSTNVAKVHDMLTVMGNTPFTSVRKAYQDLLGTDATEKWLVVLTDGDFENVSKSEVKSFFSSKDDSVRVMFFSMGQSASGADGSIDPDDSKNIFYEEALNSSDILSKITGISTRIFNSNRLPDENVTDGKASFDVPMGELTIFAQGQNVSIQGITGPDGTEYTGDSDPVQVKYSEQADSGGKYSDAIVNTDLVGQVLTIQGDFDAGTYTLDVTGADTVEVFYKPNVEIRAFLFDESGDQVDEADIRTGDYTIRFGFVKGGTEDPVETSELLGNIVYNAEITNNDNVISGVGDGDVITLQEGADGAEGTLHIDVTATFLTYNSVSTSLDLGVFSDKEIGFTETTSPTAVVSGVAADMTSDPILVQMTIAGKTPTQEQWDAMNVDDFSVIMDENGGDFYFKLQKTETPGELQLIPMLNLIKLKSSLYTGDYQYVISYEGMQGAATWSGSGVGTLHVDDQRTIWERYAQIIIKLVILAAIVILVLGYLPPFKKYLPKNLQSSPRIDCTPNKVGIRAMTAKGKVEKSVASTIIPYRAQTATIRFVPKGVGLPKLAVKAAGGRRMIVTNAAAFVKKRNVTFDGSPVEESMVKNMRIGSGCTISVAMRQEGVTYNCVPSMK